MPTADPAVVGSSGSVVTPLAVVSSLPDSTRVVEVFIGSSSQLRTVQPPQSVAIGGSMNVPNQGDIDGRLRSVETDVAIIKERLTHMPSTTDMWKSMGAAALLIIGGAWAVLQLAGPGIMKTAVRDAMTEQAPHSPAAKR